MTVAVKEPLSRQQSEAVRSLVVFSDDWGRHPSSCQHLVRQLLPDYEVAWVNTIGTRSPRLDWQTLRRALGKLREWSTPKRVTSKDDTAAEVRVFTPKMWPWFRRHFDRWLNKQLLLRELQQSIAQLPNPRVAVTTIPLVADLIGELEVDGWLYYCVDDLASWPGLDGPTLLSMEQRLIQHSDSIITVSGELQSRMRAMGRESTLLPHGVDLEHWQSDSTDRYSLPANCRAPFIVFWGLLDERLESAWVLQLAEQLKEGTILLAGPVETIDAKLAQHPRVQTLGPLEYEQLPVLARQATVLIMPYRDIAATRAMQPLKLKEYLATGHPCVVRKLPATESWSDCLDLVDSAEVFVETVLLRFGSGLPPQQQQARKRLVEETWLAKAQTFRQQIEKVIQTHRDE